MCAPDVEPGGVSEPRDSAPAVSGEQAGGLPRPDTLQPPLTPRRATADRAAALVEVILCSGFPTQIFVAAALLPLGVRMTESDGTLSGTSVAAVMLVDTVVLVALVLWFLRLHGERPRDLLLGRRPVTIEVVLGLPLAAAAFVLVVALLTLVQLAAPWLHNVARNPFEQAIRTPRDAWLFGLVAVAGGAVREEIVRAFVLRRFERYLGGAWVGLALFSVAFGLGHAVQGWDVALSTAALGAMWGIVYLRRRSIVAPLVSHAGFNLVEVFRYTLTRSWL